MINSIVFGASGQLGQCLKTITDNKGINSVYFPLEGEANILDNNALTKIFETYRPSYIINCAAYTAVDKAEDDAETALKVNKTGVDNISRLCAQYNSTLIHVSTDFVFKGDQPTPRTETDVTEPLNVYGQTKLDGEKVVEELLKKYFIIRTGWL